MSHISPTARNVIACPFCRELVAKGAVRCPHCHSNLVVPRRKKKRPFLFSQFMMGVYAATIFWLVLIILFLSRS